MRITATPMSKRECKEGEVITALKFKMGWIKKPSPGFQQAVVAWRQHVHDLPWAGTGHCLSSPPLPSPASLQTGLGKADEFIDLFKTFINLLVFEKPLRSAQHKKTINSIIKIEIQHKTSKTVPRKNKNSENSCK